MIHYLFPSIQKLKNFRTTTFLLYILKKLHSRDSHIFPQDLMSYITLHPYRVWLYLLAIFCIRHVISTDFMNLKNTAPSGITFMRSSLKIGQLAYIEKGQRLYTALIFIPD
jgi:hypothetical protein